MTLPESKLSEFVLLPELKLLHFGCGGIWTCEKVSELEVCPRCATPSQSVYDHASDLTSLKNKTLPGLLPLALMSIPTVKTGTLVLPNL